MVAGRLAETLRQPEGMNIFSRAASDFVKNTLDPNYFVSAGQKDLVDAAASAGVDFDSFADAFDSNNSTVKNTLFATRKLKQGLKSVIEILNKQARGFTGKPFTSAEVLSNNTQIFE